MIFYLCNEYRTKQEARKKVEAGKEAVFNENGDKQDTGVYPVSSRTGRWFGTVVMKEGRATKLS